MHAEYNYFTRKKKAETSIFKLLSILANLNLNFGYHLLDTGFRVSLGCVC